MIKKLFMIVLALMIGGAFMAALNSIKVSSLDPATQNTSNIISDFGRDKFVRIGWNEREEETVNEETARKQFEGLVVWNMLAASDCRGLKIIANGPYEDTLTEGELGNLNSGNRDKGYAEFEDVDPSDLDIDLEHYAVDDLVGNAVGFLPLKATGFSGECAQSGSAVFEFKDSTANIVDLDDDWIREEGKDMEGNYGKVKFNISTTFHIAPKSGENGILLGFHERFGEGFLGSDSPSIPDFYIGHRGSIILPSNINGGRGTFGELNQPELDQIKIYGQEGTGDIAELDIFNDFDYADHRHEFYAYRPRVFDGTYVFPVHQTPKIQGLKLDNDYNVRGDGDRNVEDISQEENGPNLIDHTTKYGRWYFCKGSEGHVISPSKKIDNRGESTGTVSEKEDSVFPEIHMENNGEGENSMCAQGPPSEGSWDKLKTHPDNVRGFNDGDGDIDVVFKDTYDPSDLNTGKLRCSMDQAVEKQIIYEEEVEEGQYVRFGCGLERDTFDFNDYNFEGGTLDNPQVYKGSFDFYNPAIYVQCDSNTGGISACS